MYKELEVDNLMEIDSVSSFISAIKELRESTDGTSTEWYFRGQEVEFWDIEPSIFRNDMLSIEHKLMQIPLQKIPMEFKGFDSLFDIMTKYQHYGMCTRLLDLTTNPLVALYFACKIHGIEEYKREDGSIEQEPYGVVYYTNQYYPSQSNDKEVRIVTAIASYDLNKENTIGSVLSKLKADQLIDDETEIRWLKKEYVKEFINIIQQNYMVVPTYTNERLRRQNGVFLLASMFSVNLGINVEDGIITKSKNNLRDEFDSKFFYIKGENKESILKELDLYNINESTLFPELEHQLGYIRYANADYTQAVTEFVRYEETQILIESDVCIDDNELNQYIISDLEEKLDRIVASADLEKIINLIESNLEIDWYKRSSSGSRIKNAITGYYFEKDRNREISKNQANMIMAVLNDEVKTFIASKYKGGE